MILEQLESTRLSDMDVDDFCRETMSNKDVQYSDKIDDILIMKYVMEDDLVQEKDLSLSVICSDLSFNDELQNLNLVIAEKNKTIHEQESKLNELNVLVEGLMRQILRAKTNERRLIHENSQSQRYIETLKKENQILKSKSKTYKAAVVKLCEIKQNKNQTKTKTQNKMKNKQNSKLIREDMHYGRPERGQPKMCFEFQKYGSCRRNRNRKFSHQMNDKNSNDHFLYLPPDHPSWWISCIVSTDH